MSVSLGNDHRAYHGFHVPILLPAHGRESRSISALTGSVLRLLHGDNPVGNIDARLRRNLEIAFYYVLAVRIGSKLVTCLGIERL